jgi:hypothetical protein
LATELVAQDRHGKRTHGRRAEMQEHRRRLAEASIKIADHDLGSREVGRFCAEAVRAPNRAMSGKVGFLLLCERCNLHGFFLLFGGARERVARLTVAPPMPAHQRFALALISHNIGFMRPSADTTTHPLIFFGLAFLRFGVMCSLRFAR